MSIEAMELALDAIEDLRGYRPDIDKAINALRAALSQQPDNTACKSVQKRLEAQQPAMGEPVQADSSGHLRVIASLGAALRRLSFAAQTTGGTDGPDAELQSAIGQAEQALSLCGIWQAMSATPEPVKAAPYNPTEEMRWAMKRIDPALSSDQCRALWSAAWSAAPSAHPAPSVLDDVVRDAERYRWLRNEANFAARVAPQVCMLDCLTAQASALHAEAVDAAIDAAMLAAK